MAAAPSFFVCTLLAGLLGAPGPLPAQTPAQPTLHLRAGLVGGTALVRDRLAGRGELTAGLAPAPVLSAAVRRSLGPEVALELEGGFAFGSLESESPSGSWTAGDVSVVHATLTAVTPIGSWAHARGGVGVLRMLGPDEGLLRGEDSLRPLLAGAVGGRRRVGGILAEAELQAQAHRFGTEATREMGAQDGSVLRLALVIGLVLGGGR